MTKLVSTDRERLVGIIASAVGMKGDTWVAEQVVEHLEAEGYRVVGPVLPGEIATVIDRYSDE